MADMGWGDDLMWMGEASKVHAQHPDAILHDDTAYSAVWENVSWIGAPKESYGAKEKIVVPRKPGGSRWYIEGFANSRMLLKKYIPTPAPYVITSQEKEVATALLRGAGVDLNKPFVIVNPDSKNTTFASNKDWGFVNWQMLTDILSDHVTVVRLVPPKSVVDISGLVKYNSPILQNACNVNTSTASIRQVFAINSLAACVITTEGGLHHLSAAINQQCFCIYGGVISPRNTGYANRNQTYYTGNDSVQPCGSQVDCNHCRDAMDSIRPEDISHDVIKYLNNEQVTIYQG